MISLADLLARQPDIEVLCRRLGVLRLDAFGSVVAGALEEGSDLDFLVEFDLSAGIEGYADRYFELLESLEQLFGRPVDLVVDSAIQNPYFRQSVDESRTQLYAA